MKNKLNELIVHEVDQEVIEYWFKREMLIQANHDEDGWAGMKRIHDALLKFAKLTGIEVRDSEEGEFENGE